MGVELMFQRFVWVFVHIVLLVASACTAENVIMKQVSPHQIEVYVKGKHFTTWNCGAELNSFYLNKPVLWPVLTPQGTPITRDYPFREGRVKENRDHQHHQGIFFTYGLLNYGDEERINIWNIYKPTGNYPPHGGGRYGRSPGKVIFCKNIVVKGGKDIGRIHAVSDWFSDAAQRVMLTENRIMTFGYGENYRYIDFVFNLQAKDRPVTWLDTKEGLFAIRVTPALHEAKDLTPWLGDKFLSGRARYINAQGDETEKNVWGRRSPWVALCGGLETGEQIVVMIMDHPDNLNHPTFWHARGYGLFSANPFGLRDFTKAKQVFNFCLPAEGTLTLKYRMLFYDGKADKARLADLYEQYIK